MGKNNTRSVNKNGIYAIVLFALFLTFLVIFLSNKSRGKILSAFKSDIGEKNNVCSSMVKNAFNNLNEKISLKIKNSREELNFKLDEIRAIARFIADTDKSAKDAANVTINTDFKVDKEKGYWNGIDSLFHHVFDPKLAKGLAKFFKDEDSNSIIDLGAGLGHYTNFFWKQGLTANCFDGNPDTQMISEGRCSRVDLGLEINFSKSDWVLSLEVGEHLPPNLEKMYFWNINNLNKKGAVLSWAVEGQKGDGHLNNKNNTYVINTMKNLGYTFNMEKTKELRKSAIKPWFKNTIMVFYKK